MINSIANTKFKPVLSKNTTNKKCNEMTKPQTDTFVKLKRNNISFGSFFNDGDYSFWADDNEARERRRFRVSKEDEINLGKPLQLFSAKKIDDIFAQAPKRGHGILNIYSAYADDSVTVGNAMHSMAQIMDSFDKNISPRYKTISKIDPAGSRIPFIGILAQSGEMGSGRFFERISGFTDEIVTEFGESVLGNFKRLKPKYTQFVINSAHILSNHLNPDNMQEAKIRARIIQEGGRVQESMKNLGGKLVVQASSIDSAEERIIDAQYKRQQTRTAIKGFMLGIGDGIVEHLFEAGHGVVAEVAHDLLSELKPDLFTHAELQKIAMIGLKDLTKLRR